MIKDKEDDAGDSNGTSQTHKIPPGIYLSLTCYQPELTSYEQVRNTLIKQTIGKS